MATFAAEDYLEAAVPEDAVYGIPFEVESSGPGFFNLDTTPPTVTVISPPVGTIPGSIPQAAMTPVVIDVTDLAPGIAFLKVGIRYTDEPARCDVHNGTAFVGIFTASPNAKTAISGGFRFTILPSDGWRTAFDIIVDAVDGHGNIAT